MQMAKSILEQIGIDGRRLGMFFMSGSQAQAFALAARTMTERVRALGPSELKAAEKMVQRLDDLDRDKDEEDFRGRKARRPSPEL